MKACLQMQPEFCSIEKLLHCFKRQKNEKPTSKQGNILDVDYHKLNSIMVRDTFPLFRIDEALQAIHSSSWFLSFDLSQGYLQLAMEENDIKKTAFRAGSTGL